MNNGNGTKTVKLSALQRVGLENVLGEQRGKREELRTFYDIRRKVRLTQEEKDLYMREVGGGQIAFNAAAASKAPELEVTFSQVERLRLIKLGDSMDMPVGILDWLEPLLIELEEKA